MLISALCDYYDILAKAGKILPDGYSKIGIHHLIALTPEGKIESIIDYQKEETETVKEKVKTKWVPRDVFLPKRTEKTTIDGNIIEHRPTYIFGLNYDGKTNTLSAYDDKDKAKKSHAAFVESNSEFIEGIDTPLVNAYRNFMLSWIPEQETQNEKLLVLGRKLTTERLAFCLAGHTERLLQDEPEIRQKWETVYQKRIYEENADSQKAQCCINGSAESLARIHAKLKSFPGGSSTGNAMISFNSAAEESYGKSQSYNSCISSTAMQKYTAALNYLSAGKKHWKIIGDTTYIYWAVSAEPKYEAVFSALLFDNQMDQAETDTWLNSVFSGIKKGIAAGDIVNEIGNIDRNINFYIVGMKPNSARLAVKCIYRQNFGEILQNTVQHYADMQIGNNSRPVTVSAICKELISPKSSNDEVSPALMAKLLDAIINGTPYPAGLLASVVRRVKTDSDEENRQYIKMNDVRMGLIKACINRNARLNGKKEEIKMALDTENTNPAYLCGRLFCKLEEIQKKAQGDINRTIKDAYFSVAASRPATAFPKLISLSLHHLAKLDDKTANFMDKDVAEIIGKMGNEFPANLSLKDQGIFMLGYYQQKNQKFEKKNTVAADEE